MEAPPVNDTATAYDGDNFFSFNISGVGITTRVAEVVPAEQRLKYELSVDGTLVYVQYLDHNGINVNEDLSWYFDHPLDIEAGSTNHASIYKVTTVDNQEVYQGLLLVCEGDVLTNGVARYQTSVRNRLFTDKFLAYQESLDALVTGSEYKGAWDANTNTPDITLTSSETNGQFYRVSVSGTYESVDYEYGDMIVYNSTTVAYDHIPVKAATNESIESSSLSTYDIYVKAGFTGDTKNGSALYPFSTIETAVAAANDGDSIFMDGTFSITSDIVLPPSKSLSFTGMTGSVIQYATYSTVNGSLVTFTGTDNTKTLGFENIEFKNAGGYGLHLLACGKISIENCKFTNNGWDGTALHTVLDSTTSTVLGYDSDAADLQAFYAGSHASNGGAMRLENSTIIRVVGNEASNNLRGFRIQDCGINGFGFVTRNVATQNIESGIYIAAGSLGGSHNITTTMNISSYNANNGLLVIGGINNKFSQNEVNGNWNAGFCAWGAANSTLRDCGLYDNNRSAYNGIGNTGDAKASIQINDAYNLLDTQITYNPAFRFIAEILDTQVHYTGLGSNTEKIGFLITSAVGAIADNPKNIIKVDDVGFIGQDYAIDLSEVDVSNLRLSLGDNSYQSIALGAVKSPSAGNYSELPFSNHVMQVPEVDIVVDTLKMTIALHEGVGGNVINMYGVNELQSVINGNSIDILQKGSDKIQLKGLTLGNVYVNGVAAGSNLNTMNDSVNSALDMTLIEYKEFIESEVGVDGGGDTATFYYIESPDNNFEYPLFKTEAEANTFDLANGGTGTSHTHTYADDATNTTWYMPTNLGVMNGTSAPTNGAYGTSTNVIWNLQTTEPDSNYAPTFTDVAYSIAEGSAVNVQYKPAGDASIYSLSTLPAGYADNGYAIIGTAETITDGVDIQHIITVTKANDFGSVIGYITLNITNDVTNDVSSNSTSWTKAVDFSGSNQFLKMPTASQAVGALRMGGGINTVAAHTSDASKTSNNSGSRPWATSVVFKYDGNNSDQHIWNSGEGSGTQDDNIYLRLDGSGWLYFGWGREHNSDINECKFKYLGTVQNVNHWHGIYIAHKGTRLTGSGATAANLATAFDIRFMSSINSFATLGSNLSTVSNWTNGLTGNRMDRGVGGDITVGGRGSNRGFYGKVASFIQTTLLRDVAMPTDAEIQMMVADPSGWLTDYKVGNSFRHASSVTEWSNFQIDEAYSSYATQVWLMGDGPVDSYSNGARNGIMKYDSNFTKLQFVNMASNDIENVTIPGLS